MLIASPIGYVSSAVPIAVAVIDLPVPFAAYQLAEFYLIPVAWLDSHSRTANDLLDWENDVIGETLGTTTRVLIFSPLHYYNERVITEVEAVDVPFCVDVPPMEGGFPLRISDEEP
jgi:hypothetical protein